MEDDERIEGIKRERFLTFKLLPLTVDYFSAHMIYVYINIV